MSEQLQRAVEKKIAEELEITWVGKAHYGTSITGETIPGRIVGGRTQTLRFSALISDEPALDPRWQIGESRIVKLLVTHDRDLKPRENKALFEWNLGSKVPPRTQQAKQLVDFVASQTFLTAIQVHERMESYKAGMQSTIMVAEDRGVGYAAASKQAPQEKQRGDSQELAAKTRENAIKELHQHWERSLDQFDQLEKARGKNEPRKEHDAVDRLRSNLDKRLTQALEGLSRDSHDRGYER